MFNKLLTNAYNMFFWILWILEFALLRLLDITLECQSYSGDSLLSGAIIIVTNFADYP